MLKPRFCAGGDHPQVWSQGNKLAPFLQQFSQCYLCLHLCVCLLLLLMVLLPSSLPDCWWSWAVLSLLHFPILQWTVGPDLWFLSCWGMAFLELGTFRYPAEMWGMAQGGWGPNGRTHSPIHKTPASPHHSCLSPMTMLLRTPLTSPSVSLSPRSSALRVKGQKRGRTWKLPPFTPKAAPFFISSVGYLRRAVPEGCRGLLSVAWRVSPHDLYP